MTTKTPSVIYIDARALQDPDYRFRGVGQHSATLIEALRRRAWTSRRPRLVAVTDVARDELQPVHRRLFDNITTLVRPEPSGPKSVEDSPTWFLSLSPMTHDPVWAAAFLYDTSVFRVALFYDLIPLQFPERYLVSPATRIDYMVALSWLRRYAAFAAISRSTADTLIERMAVNPAKVFVTGVGLRRTLEPSENEVPLSRAERRLVVVPGGGDPRKNPECALTAHAKSKALQRAGMRLVVLGAYPDSMRADLRALYGKHGGSPEQLEFQPHLSDEALHRIYRQGLATVVPSRAEGFSIPILESIAAGTPVLASDAGAHPELARDPAWRFDPDQPDQLRYLLERLLSEEQAWTAVRDFQAPVWREYTVDRVGENFAHCVLARCPDPHPAPAVKRGARPSIAVLTPLPPANSGVADYSAVTLRPLKVSADLHMFTPTRNAGWENGWASLGPVSAAKFSPRIFDATISVIGNSDHHTEIFDYLLNYGGACLAHDARQIDFYVHEKGMARALEVASAEYGQRVSEAQLQHWLQCQRDLPVLFLSEMAKASSPLLVHSPVTADMIKDLYKVKPRVLPFAQYRILPSDMGTESARRRARDRLGIREGMIVLTTFGYVHSDKGAEDLVWTLKMLQNWGIDVQLVFCGTGHVDILAQIVALARSLDLVDRVVTFSDKVSESTYVEYLAASDAGVQLRRYFMGGLSGALNDCIAAGIPSIANEHLATAMVAPTYVRRVPDNLSSVLIAEAVLEILSTGENLKRPLDEMQAFRAKHSPEVYSEAILEALSIDLSSY